MANPAANGQLAPPSCDFLPLSRVSRVDARDRIREVYNVGFLKVPWVVEDVELLLKGKD